MVVKLGGEWEGVAKELNRQGPGLGMGPSSENLGGQWGTVIQLKKLKLVLCKFVTLPQRRAYWTSLQAFQILSPRHSTLLPASYRLIHRD